jgi:hypothetical protein
MYTPLDVLFDCDGGDVKIRELQMKLKQNMASV